MDKIKGYLEIGTNGRGEVVVNHPALDVDDNGVGHVVLSPGQARDLADALRKKAVDADREAGTLSILYVDCPACGAKGDGSLCVGLDGRLLFAAQGLVAHGEREAARLAQVRLAEQES